MPPVQIGAYQSVDAVMGKRRQPRTASTVGRCRSSDQSAVASGLVRPSSPPVWSVSVQVRDAVGTSSFDPNGVYIALGRMMRAPVTRDGVPRLSSSIRFTTNASVNFTFTANANLCGSNAYPFVAARIVGK